MSILKVGYSLIILSTIALLIPKAQFVEYLFF